MALYIPAEKQSTGPIVQLINGASIKPEAIDWLWNGMIAAGKLHILAGAPGTGKTTLALALGAALTVGGRWPDGSRVSAAGDVLIWSGEDDPTDTLAPRLMACGADMKRIHFVGSVRESDEHRPFDPASDMAGLAAAARRVGNVRLLICDPVVSAVTGDSHKNTEVRRALQPLVDLGHEIDAAILGISHFSKGSQGRDPTERVAGSLAFGALARVVLAAAKVQDDDSEHAGRRILARTKSNIGPDDGGFYYDLEQVELAAHPGVWASRVRWGEAIEGSAREILAAADTSSDSSEGEGSAFKDAQQYLRELLHAGPVSAKTVRVDSRDAGHSWSTVRRAQKALGIVPKKGGMNEGWQWHLPAEGAHENTKVPTPNRRASSENDEHLREDDQSSEEAETATDEPPLEF